MLSFCVRQALYRQHKFQSCLFSTHNATTVALAYDKFGPPDKELHLRDDILMNDNDVPSDKAIEVEMLYAPINPADLNTIQGVYPLKPRQFPAVGGLEGVGRCVRVPESIRSSISEGDLVLPMTRSRLFGCWRRRGILTLDECVKLPSDVDLKVAATVAVNPCTALRMLRDFVPLAAGDVVIQNAANGAVGRAVIQLCRLANVPSINVIRDTGDTNETLNLKEELIDLGATMVVTEKELRTLKLSNSIGRSVPLGLNAVCGESGANMISFMQKSRPKDDDRSPTVVTYGAMSRKPVICSAGAFIFGDVTLRGFWMSEWKQRNDIDASRQMINELMQLYGSEDLKASPVEIVALSKFEKVFSRESDSSARSHTKVLFDIQR